MVSKNAVITRRFITALSLRKLAPVYKFSLTVRPPDASGVQRSFAWWLPAAPEHVGLRMTGL
jgi:hypothetical protein